jgi:hypothetical protein
MRFVAQKTTSAATFAVMDEDRRTERVICIAVNRRAAELIVTALNLCFRTGDQLELFDKAA